MKNKLLLFIIGLSTTPAFAKGVSGEIKAGAVFFFKISAGVAIAALIIGIGLWIYSLVLKKKELLSSDSKASEFKCEIDDTKTIDEAITTFLNINN